MNIRYLFLALAFSVPLCAVFSPAAVLAGSQSSEVKVSVTVVQSARIDSLAGQVVYGGNVQPQIQYQPTESAVNTVVMYRQMIINF